MSKLKKWSIVIATLATIAFMTVIGGIYYYQTELNGYPDTKNFADQLNALPSDSQKKTVLVFHKPGCSDCKNARSTIKNTMQSHKQKINYIVVNVNQANAATYLAKYGVTQVPTVIALSGDKVVDSTSSSNQETIASVTAGE